VIFAAALFAPINLKAHQRRVSYWVLASSGAPRRPPGLVAHERPARRIEPHAVARASGDQAIAVVLDLVHPIRTALAFIRCGRKARRDEALAAEDGGQHGGPYTWRLLTVQAPIRPNVCVDQAAARAHHPANRASATAFSPTSESQSWSFP
jgi:hypothetical protein